MQVILLVFALACALLGVFVLFNSVKQDLFRIYFLFSIFSSFWMLANSLSIPGPITPHGLLLLNISRCITPFSLLASLSFLLFVRYFKASKLSATNLWVALPSLATSAFSFTKLNVSLQGHHLVLGNLYPIYAATLILNISLIFYELFSKGSYRRHQMHRHLQSQLKYLRIGAIGSLIPALIFGVIVPLLSASTIANIAPLFSIVFLVAAALAIIRHQLFDVRFFVVRALAYGFSVGLITLFYLLPAIWLISHVVHVHVSDLELLALAVLSLILTLLYRYLRTVFDKLTKRIFYRNYYDSQDVIDQLSDVLVRTIDLEQLEDSGKQIIMNTLGIRAVEYWLNHDKKIVMLPRFKHFFDNVNETNVILLEEVTGHSEELAWLNEQRVAVLMRLNTTHGELGFIALGFKQSGGTYTRQDLRLLETISEEIAISMQNALHFVEIQAFNDTLRQRVQQATRELRRTNEKLRLLDETKDEFITMASHQLRTPLTSVKGYLSMVLEGDAGKLTAQQTKLLTQSYISSQRMVYLISDLLNLSRLNTGKFVIELAPVNLVAIVQSEIDQLVETAKSRDVVMTFQPPADFSRLMLDETKLRQVVMNLLDNAIYYTRPGGTINISLRETATAVEFSVRDNGIGVPKAEQHKLFTKFYRAPNAQQARPDGTGLGLFMAKKVVAAQGGAIIFESEEGKGSTFGFRFSKADRLVPTTPAVPASANLEK